MHKRQELQLPCSFGDYELLEPISSGFQTGKLLENPNEERRQVTADPTVVEHRCPMVRTPKTASILPDLGSNGDHRHRCQEIPPKDSARTPIFHSIKDLRQLIRIG